MTGTRFGVFVELERAGRWEAVAASDARDVHNLRLHVMETAHGDGLLHDVGELFAESVFGFHIKRGIAPDFSEALGFNQFLFHAALQEPFLFR